jgi:hypothetical protein
MSIRTHSGEDLIFFDPHTNWIVNLQLLNSDNQDTLCLGFPLRRPAFPLCRRDPLSRFLAHRSLGARVGLRLGGFPARSTPSITGQQSPHFAELGDFMVESFDDRFGCHSLKTSFREF